MIGVEDLVAQARSAFGWTDAVTVTAGPRGALGQIWQLEVGSARYALKHIFNEPPTEESIRIELDLTGRVTRAGIHTAVSHTGRDGRYLHRASDGTWFRCYDWLDLRALPAASPCTAHRLGALLARLHRCAPPCSTEPNGGGPPDPWYHRAPAPAEWPDVTASSAWWATRLHHRLTTLPHLCADIRPVDAARSILCHRDLHPENVFIDPTDQLTVVDWDDFGPADPSRELAGALFDWCSTETAVDLDAVDTMMVAYLREEGPGRVTEPADFSMLLAARLNYLATQARLVLDPETERAQREWAEYEIDAVLRFVPTSRQLADILAVARRQPGAITS